MSQQNQQFCSGREHIIPIQIEGDEPEEGPISESKLNVSSVSENESTPDFLIEETEVFDDTDEIVKNNLPLYNTQEKIILIVDSCEDEHSTPFKLESSSQPSLYIIKRAISLLVKTKNLINRKHEFAVIVLTDTSAVWKLDFTSNLNKIETVLDQIKSSETEDIYELDSLFELILDKVKVPEFFVTKECIVPPQYTVRAILFYNRSYTLPKLNDSKEIQHLLASPLFTLDVVMTHEPIGIDNHCEKIANTLQNVDRKGFGYFLSAARDARRVFEAAATLVGHPLQRPIQKLSKFNVEDDEVSEGD